MEGFIRSWKATPEVILCIPHISGKGYKQNLLEFTLAFSVKAANVKILFRYYD